MYVSQPMSQEKRLELKGRADRIRDEILSKADENLIDLIKKKGIGEIEGAQLKLEGSGTTGEWLRVTPKKEEGPISFGGDAIPEPELEDRPRRSARDLISDYDKVIEESGRFPKGRKEVSRKPSPEAAPELASKAPAKTRAKKAAKRKARKEVAPSEGDDINVIRIVEKGVYEINVERLLDDSPIIIEKDGSYLIHLPSLLESGKLKKR